MADEELDTTSTRHADRVPDLRSLGEAELVQELRANNGDAMAVVFDRYYRLVLVTAFRILGDMGEAEDVMQSVFFEIYQKAAQFDPSRGTLSKWILQYSYHRSINRKNYLMTRHFYNRSDVQAENGEELWSTKVFLPPQEARRLANESLALLSGQQREVVELVFLQGLTLGEIAEQSKQTLVSVRHHYYRGLRRLRNYLSAEPGKNGSRAVAPLAKEGRANA